MYGYVIARLSYRIPRVAMIDATVPSLMVEAQTPYWRLDGRVSR